MIQFYDTSEGFLDEKKNTCIQSTLQLPIVSANLGNSQDENEVLTSVYLFFIELISFVLSNFMRNLRRTLR